MDPNDTARPPSRVIASILEATQLSDNPVALSPCLRCEHSTVLQLSDNTQDTPAGLAASPPSLVMYCGRMHRDITTPIAACSGFSPAPDT